MAAGALTRDFFRNGGRIFAGEHSTLANQVRAFGLATAVTIVSAGSLTHGQKPLQIDNALSERTIAAVRDVEAAVARVFSQVHFSPGNPFVPKEFAPSIKVPQEVGASDTAGLSKLSDSGVIAAVVRSRGEMFLEASQAEGVTHQFGDFEISHALMKDIVRAAHDADFPVTYLFGMAEKESGFDPSIKAQRSSAVGLMQFIEQTWLRVVKENGARFGLEKEAGEIQVTNNKRGQPVYTIADRQELRRVLDLRTVPYLSAVMAAVDLKSAKSRIEQSLGERFPDENLYLPHFLGEDRAEAALAAYDEQPQSPAHKLLRREAHANPGMFYDKSKGRRHPVNMATFIKRSQDVILNRAEKYADVETMAASPVSAFLVANTVPVPQLRPDVGRDRFVSFLNARIAGRKLPSIVDARVEVTAAQNPFVQPIRDDTDPILLALKL